jgi:hypothetical protein
MDLSSLIYRHFGMDFLTRLVKFIVEEIDVCVCVFFVFRHFAPDRSCKNWKREL